MNSKKIQLPLQTVSLVLGFMVWVILSSLMPYIKEDIKLTALQLTFVTAVPILIGSLMRIPAGYWTNRYGARKLFFISFILLLAPIYWVSISHTFTDLIIGGFFLGIGGGVFSVGVTSLPKYYAKERHGFVNGIYGIGNLGTALSTFGAPVVAKYYGWETAVQLYMILLAAMILLNFFLGDRDEPKVKASLVTQIKGVYKNEKLWILCFFYFITFGAFVAFSVYLPNFLVTHFHLTKVDAGFRTGGFIVLATAMRPIGGWLADRWNPFRMLMYVFGGLTIAAILLSFAPSIGLYTVGCLLVAFCAGTGNGTIFKLVPMYFTKQAGIANGLISAMGGLGGFFPPLMLTILFNLTGHYAIGFMALSQVALASLIIVVWMFYQEKLSLALNIVEQMPQGIMITNPKGIIQSVNHPFTAITGFTEEEAVGKTPRILKSGIQAPQFYKNMWAALHETGTWQGEIQNRRKNGEIYIEWLTINGIKTKDGEIKSYAGVFSDITNHRVRDVD
jgi:NNP family nitrate/nitrite transporter-like MFS transporter